MRKTAQKAITDALDAINESLKELTGAVKGLQVALSEREKDFEARHSVHELELKRHDRQIIDLQGRRAGGVAR